MCVDLVISHLVRFGPIRLCVAECAGYRMKITHDWWLVVCVCVCLGGGIQKIGRECWFRLLSNIDCLFHYHCRGVVVEFLCRVVVMSNLSCSCMATSIIRSGMRSGWRWRCDVMRADCVYIWGLCRPPQRPHLTPSQWQARSGGYRQRHGQMSDSRTRPNHLRNW